LDRVGGKILLVAIAAGRTQGAHNEWGDNMTLRLHLPVLKLLFVLAMLILPGPTQVRATEYNFTVIVDSQGSYHSPSVISQQALNENGVVAFYNSNDSFDNGYYKGNGGAITTVVTYAQLGGLTGGAINDGGTVAYAGSPGPFREGVYTGSGISNPVIGYHADGTTSRNFSDPTINNSGAVAYRGSRSGFPDQAVGELRTATYLFEGGIETTLAEDIGGIYNRIDPRPSVINDSGQVAFEARTNDNVWHIVRYDHPGFSTITPAVGFSSNISMNNSGDIAYIAGNDIWKFHNGASTSVANLTDGFSSFGTSNAMINDTGKVAFDARYNNSANVGIFAGPDVVNDRVISTGDVLFGETIQDLSLVGFNNSGQVAVSISFAGAAHTILAVATPTLPGDYNQNGTVDVADYVVWRKDPNRTQAGYDLWRSHFGQPGGSGAGIGLDGTAVPEATSLSLAAITLLLASTARRRVAPQD
jgi:hypothetical protein